MVDLKLGLICMSSVSSQMIVEEAKKHFSQVDLIDIRKVEIMMNNKQTKVLYDGKELEKYDCLYLKSSHRYAELMYGLTEIFKDDTFIPLQAQAHLLAHNKFLTHLTYAQNKILKMPDTYYAAKISETKNFLQTLNYPIILKFPSGTHGKGVIFSESSKSARSMVDALDVFKQPLIVQDYINIESDIRVIVTGNRIAGSMRRIAAGGEIRANAHMGGNAEPYVVTSQIKEMCLEAAKKIGAKICAVDIIESDYGPLILEVNTSPGLQKITEVTKKNIAGEIAQYLFEETSKIKESKDKIQSRDLMGQVGIEEIGERDFQVDLVIRNGKIVLPEFVSRMSSFRDEEEVTLKITDDKIEILKN
ncbi:MAG: ATP-grasp domain-containing protein [Candidatus Woesearchaeota archaeon]